MYDIIPLFRCTSIRTHTPFSHVNKDRGDVQITVLRVQFSHILFTFFFLLRLFVRLDDVFFGFFVWDVLPRIDALITLYDGNV